VSEYRNDAIPSYIFPEGLHANARLMPATAGKFNMEMTEYDYPPRALREGMTGISTIAIGISPYGIIESCTPQVSSGFLLLDLGACDLVRKNGVFTNSDEVRRDDVRYVLRRIRWQ
jgi:Gram-negative bacterial TonB protein C-terminal